MADVDHRNVPFQEAIEFFRDKLSLPTQAWTDIWEGMHARAFVVAGAMREDLLTDLREAVDRAISEGTGLEAFRREFDQIVARHGWQYRGGRAWRTRVIYATNMRAAYMAGRFKQMQAVAATRPYWLYRHNDGVANPRPEHLAWDGLVLRHDDPWWSTHYPPNGWGCQCRVFTLSERQLQARGKTGADRAPPSPTEVRRVGTRGPSPRTVRVPEGVDPGFAYNVGEAAWGRQLSDDVMQTWRDQGGRAWQPLTTGDWSAAGRLAEVPLDPAIASLGGAARTETEAAERLRAVLGAEEKVYRVAGLPVLVNAETLARHVDPRRAEYLPLLEETLNDPFEVWLAFEQHRGTGLVALRARVVKAFDLGRGRSAMVVANARRGVLEAWTLVPTSSRRYANQQRRGDLILGRE